MLSAQITWPLPARESSTDTMLSLPALAIVPVTK